MEEARELRQEGHQRARVPHGQQVFPGALQPASLQQLRRAAESSQRRGGEAAVSDV
jgi:hypothetical protein